jgi:hypothetical protein
VALGILLSLLLLAGTFVLWLYLMGDLVVDGCGDLFCPPIARQWLSLSFLASLAAYGLATVTAFWQSPRWLLVATAIAIATAVGAAFAMVVTGDGDWIILTLLLMALPTTVLLNKVAPWKWG